MAQQVRWSDDSDRGHRASVLWARVTPADDFERSSLPRLGDIKNVQHSGLCVFDGIVQDGDALLLKLVDLERAGDPNHGEPFYSRRFTGAISTWLGEHMAQHSGDRLCICFRVDDLTTELGTPPISAHSAHR